MKSVTGPVVKDLVLIGGGHSHVAVLRNFGMSPLPGVRLTLICRDAHTPYSGMLPGYVAGHYDYDEAHIDLGALSRFAGARFLHAAATGIDLGRKRVICDGRPPVPFDVLSINTGASPGAVPGAAEAAIPIKPIDAFLDGWQALCERAASGPLRIAVVGAGAGGVEILLAVRHRLAEMRAAAGRSADDIAFRLFGDSDELLPAHSASMRRTFRGILRRGGVAVHLGHPIVEVSPGGLRDATGAAFEADEILWATGASAPEWPAKSGLAVDKRGFVRIKDTLQSVSHPDVFAAGDIASMDDHPRPKSGVFAVRQGKPLAHNLRHRLLGRRPRRYRPQTNFLSLISVGEKRAIASYGPLSFGGAAVWKWKDWIDRRFMAKYNDPPFEEESGVPPEIDGPDALDAVSGDAMRCGGCGGKIGATILERALGNLSTVQREEVVVGLREPDDAAVVAPPTGKVMVHTVDSFRAMVDDPYVFGKIAANHSLGDIYAMGATPQTALAIANLPYGAASKVEDTLIQMMSGAVEILNDAGCALVGGHTAESAELSLGFAINGTVDRERVMRKGGLRPGDALLITKPVGTGTLFAADMRCRARGRWIAAALSHMVQSNREAAECLFEHGASAVTDVTGFGLIGHLMEMLRSADLEATLSLGSVPVMDGAEETIGAGLLSSLQPQNARLRDAVRGAAVAHPRFPLLFDPQTAGGLLAGVPPDRAADCVAALRDRGYPRASIVGAVGEPSGRPEPIVVEP